MPDRLDPSKDRLVGYHNPQRGIVYFWRRQEDYYYAVQVANLIGEDLGEVMTVLEREAVREGCMVVDVARRLLAGARGHVQDTAAREFRTKVRERAQQQELNEEEWLETADRAIRLARDLESIALRLGRGPDLVGMVEELYDTLNTAPTS